MDTVSTPSLKDNIVDILRREIYCGNLQDGEELAQEIISEHLGVSRMPVREAFLQLESEGILQRLPNRHVQVIGMTKQRMLQNFSVLAALEIEFLLQICTQHLPQESVQVSFQKYTAAVPLQGKEKCAEKETAYHLSFSKALDNPALYRLHEKQRKGFCSYYIDVCALDWKSLYFLNQKVWDAFLLQDKNAIRTTLKQYYTVLTQHAIKEIHLE